MAVNTTWTLPTGSTLDLATGFQVTETNWDAHVSNTYRLGGTDGNSKTGPLYIGGTTFANAFQTVGVTVNQAGATNEVYTAKRTGALAHGMTGITDTDTFLAVSGAAAAGGAMQIGFSTATVGLSLRGYGTTDDTIKGTTGSGYIQLLAAKKSGTAIGAAGANANLLVLVEGTGATRFIFDQEGDSHEDGTGWTAYDDYDDVALIASVEGYLARDPLRAEFRDWMTYNRESLQAARLVTFNDDGHHFVNRSRMQMAICGAIRQLAARVIALEGAS